MNRLAQFVRRACRAASPFGVAPRADFGDDPQLRRIRMQRLFDQLICDMGAIEIAGIDVGDPQLDHRAEDGDRPVVIGRRPEDMRPRELHRAISHAGQSKVVGEGERPSRQCLCCHLFPPGISAALAAQNHHVVHLLEEGVIAAVGLGEAQRLDPLDAVFGSVWGRLVRMLIVSQMKSLSGMAFGSLAWRSPISSVCTYGGTISITCTAVSLSW